MSHAGVTRTRVTEELERQIRDAARARPPLPEPREQDELRRKRLTEDQLMRGYGLWNDWGPAVDNVRG